VVSPSKIGIGYCGEAWRQNRQNKNISSSSETVLFGSPNVMLMADWSYPTDIGNVGIIMYPMRTRPLNEHFDTHSLEITGNEMMTAKCE
jgi:hypothetical protein